MKGLYVFCIVLCVTVRTFAAQQEQIDPVQVPDVNDCAIRQIFARVWKYYPLVEKERAAWIVINSEGKYQSIDWLHSPQRAVTVWSAPIPKGVIAQAHTHNDHLDPKPSSQDVAVSRKLNIPVYTLTRKGIWRAMPNGSITLETGRGWFDKANDACGELSASNAVPGDSK